MFKGVAREMMHCRANEVFDSGLFDPTGGFGLFEFEFGDGFDGVTGREDFCVRWTEFVREADCT